MLARIAKAEGDPIHAIEGMASAIRRLWDDGKGPQVTIVSTGPMTNVALFVSVFPELLQAIGAFRPISLLQIPGSLTYSQKSLSSWVEASDLVTGHRLQVCSSNCSAKYFD